uniref:Uncharacterized protein n=1 Tax=Mesocestoides corti TaxID=53468 RepID=A0A5K3F6C3_MESCO
MECSRVLSASELPSLPPISLQRDTTHRYGEHDHLLRPVALPLLSGSRRIRQLNSFTTYPPSTVHLLPPVDTPDYHGPRLPLTVVTENVPAFYTAPPRRKPFFQSKKKQQKVECSVEEEVDKHEVEEKTHNSPVKSTNSRRRRRCRRRKPLASLSQSGS